MNCTAECTNIIVVSDGIYTPAEDAFSGSVLSMFCAMENVAE